MSQEEFAEALRDLVGQAEDAGLHRHEMIEELEEMAQAMREGGGLVPGERYN